MSASVENECKDPAGHRQHLCQLRKQGLQQGVAELMKDPGHTCLNCNAVTKNAKDLCNPSSFIKV